MDAFFTSIESRDEIGRRVHEVLERAAAAWPAASVDLHLMAFSFTDESIAARLASLARLRGVTVRVIADWGQGSAVRAGPVRRLAADGAVQVRYKHDQPYVWDGTTSELRWSYRASRGLLHHKSLAVYVDGAPVELLCGSANWTARASRGYENLTLVHARDPGGRDVMDAFEREFEALWCDGHATLSPAEARAHHHLIRAQYRRRPSLAPGEIDGLIEGDGAVAPGLVAAPGQAAHADDVLVAFSARSPYDAAASNGYDAANRERRFTLRKPGGATKRVPLTITNLALDVIARAEPGDTLRLAMYGLSPRVAEYGALLAAARRGVRLHVLLDGRVCRAVLARLAVTLADEDLPVRLRSTSRTMHQKYLLHTASSTVLTGTANMSTDATDRHSEHRLVVREDPALCARFGRDFTTIWGRLASPFSVE